MPRRHPAPRQAAIQAFGLDGWPKAGPRSAPGREQPTSAPIQPGAGSGAVPPRYRVVPLMGRERVDATVRGVPRVPARVGCFSQVIGR